MIDRWLRPWPTEVRDALARFEQGDAVAEIPFAYHGVGKYALWALSESDSDAQELFPLDRSQWPPYGIIATQTCDLLEEDNAAPCKPWFQAVPAYVWPDLGPGDIEQISLHQIPHLVRLTGGGFADSLWVADLRIELPVEKSWLVGKAPMSAFASRLDREAFADRLAAYRNRPALSALVHTCIVKTVRRWFEHRIRKPAGALLLAGKILGVRVLLDESGAGTNARLIFIVDDEASIPEVDGCMKKLCEACRLKAENTALTIYPNEYKTMDMSARLYLASKPIRVDHLFDRARNIERTEKSG